LLEKLNYLITPLATYYQEHRGWDLLTQDKNGWFSLIRHGWIYTDQNTISEKKIENSSYKDSFVTLSNQQNHIPLWDPLNLGHRIGLFDQNKKLVVSIKGLSLEECYLLPIDLDGKTIGWLGILKEKKIIEPLDKMFIHAQLKIFFTMACIFIFILAAMWILYSKSLIKPIIRLVSATKKLGSRNFDIQIPIESSDELGELAQNFNDMAKKLARYEQNQKQWLMDISHELRTPLSALMCEIDALKDGIRRPNKDLFLSLSDEMKYLIRLVNDIHDISLIDSGFFLIKNEYIKPLSILSQEIYIFQERLERNDMTLDVQLEMAAVNLKTRGDSNSLKQLFSNIIENAILYTKKPGNLIIRHSREEEYIKFIFENSGPGVPEKALPLLFNRLYRVDSSHNHKTHGSGLGLAICKSIVDIYKGKIRAQNVDGGGLLIEILLPVEKITSEAINQQLDMQIQRDVA
jgi:two-component system, OmpR family, sensor histidine kinase BaeS